MLSAVGLFLIGSAISGASQNMNMLLAGRSEHFHMSHWMFSSDAFDYAAVQGIGGGAILNLSEIIVSDLVPLAERGMYMGMFACTWALASGVGPPIVSGIPTNGCNAI